MRAQAWIFLLACVTSACTLPPPTRVAPPRAPVVARPAYEMPAMPGSGARPWVEPDAVQLEALPRVRLPARVGAPEDLEDLFRRGTTPTHRGIYSPYRHCTAVRNYLPLRFETMGRDDQGAPVFALTDAVLEASSCQLRQIRRSEIRPLAIASGLAFAFVSVAPDADGELSEKLEVVVPNTGEMATSGREVDVVVSWEVVRASLPLKRGTSASVVTVVHRYNLQGWLDSTAGSSDARRVLDRFAGITDMTVTVEVGQGVRDRAPLAIAFIRTPMF